MVILFNDPWQSPNNTALKWQTLTMPESKGCGCAHPSVPNSANNCEFSHVLCVLPVFFWLLWATWKLNKLHQIQPELISSYFQLSVKYMLTDLHTKPLKPIPLPLSPPVPPTQLQVTPKQSPPNALEVGVFPYAAGLTESSDPYQHLPTSGSPPDPWAAAR